MEASLHLGWDMHDACSQCPSAFSVCHPAECHKKRSVRHSSTCTFSCADATTTDIPQDYALAIATQSMPSMIAFSETGGKVGEWQLGAREFSR